MLRPYMCKKCSVSHNPPKGRNARIDLESISDNLDINIQKCVKSRIAELKQKAQIPT